jgi:hypothetical protein
MIYITLRHYTGAHELTNTGTRSKRTTAAAAPKKRRMSAEGRKRMAEAQRTRWAAQKEKK